MSRVDKSYAFSRPEHNLRSTEKKQQKTNDSGLSVKKNNISSLRF